MSEQQVHTPGRIRYYENGEANSFAILEEEADGRWLLSLLHNGHDVTERQKANMRRLAACWNALVHVSTEQLETGEMYSMGQAIADLTRERDQLQDRLTDIGNFAHDKSTGPAVPDALWEVRRMAYGEHA